MAPPPEPRLVAAQRSGRRKFTARTCAGNGSEATVRDAMNGLGGLNRSPEGVVLGLVQLQLPVVATKADLVRQTEKVSAMVTKAKKGLPTLDLVVFPEYALHGLSMDTSPEIMCRLDGPEVAAFKAACVREQVWGCFSIMEQNPHGNPYNSGLVIDAAGELRLY